LRLRLNLVICECGLSIGALGWFVFELGDLGFDVAMRYS
jgi:hypothetical protein